MANNRMDELFSRLEQSSSDYADRATQLSEAILEFEERLHLAMKGKFTASVVRENPQPAFNLGYDRVDNRWRLCFARGNRSLTWRPLQEAAVRHKIFAVGMFEELLKEIVGKQEDETEELHAALDGISPYLNVAADQKGSE